MQSLKDLPLKQCPTKSQHQSFYQIRKQVNQFPLICAKVNNGDTVIIYQTYLTTLQSLKLTGYKHKFSVKTVQHGCDLEIWSRSLKVVWTGKAQCVVPSCKV